MDKNTLLEFIKSFWVVASVIALSIVLMFIFWFMTIQARGEFLQKNEEYNVLAGKRANTLQVNRDKEGLAALEERLNSSFVDKSKVVEFIEFIESTARNTGNSISLSNISEGNGIQNIKVNLDGSYSATANFLAQIESSPYLVRVTNIVVNRSSGLGESKVRTVLDIQIQLP